jgi:superfamily I DNA/RNA helicase
MVSYGADDQQILYPEQATTQEELANIFENNQKYFLDENFRNSYEIMLFIKAFFKRRVIDQNILDRLLQEGKRSRKPRLLISNSINKQEEAIIDIINNFNSATHNIAILVPFKDDVERYSMLIENAGILCSSFSSSNESINKIENIHITTFKSSKGLEFDTVIIPNFETALSNVTKSRIITSNDYYVAITRAKRNLYLISSYIPAFLERSEQQKLTYDKETL